MKEELKSRIQEFRELSGLTQRDLAEAVGVSEATIANWEKGRSSIDMIDKLIRLCSVLRCRLEDLVEREDLSGEDLREVDLSGQDFRGKNLSSANFSGAKLDGANFQAVRMREVNLSNASLQSSNLERADLENANLEKANLRNANLKNANLKNANLRFTDLTQADLRESDLRKADVEKAKIERALIKSADLRDIHNLNPALNYELQDEYQPPFIIGGIPDQDSSRLDKMHELLSNYLRKKLGVDTQRYRNMEVSATENRISSYEATMSAFVYGNIDLAWLGGFTLIRALDQLRDAIVIAQRPVDKHFRTIIIANTNTIEKYKSIFSELSEDNEKVEILKELCTGPNKLKLALGTKLSTSGDLIPIHYLVKAGINESCFNEVRASGSHDATIRLVASGMYDIGALSQQVWNSRTESRGVPPQKVIKKKVIKIWQSPQYQNYAWVVHSNILDSDKRGGLQFVNRVRQALLEIHEDSQGEEILNLFGTEQFEKADNADYASLREIVQQREKDKKYFYSR